MWRSSLVGARVAAYDAPAMLSVVFVATVSALQVGAPAEETATARASSDVLEEVATLFRKGQDRFDTSDFIGAIELWTEAYEALPEDPAYASTRATLLLGIAQAHVQAHEVDGEDAHLRRADMLLGQYLESVDPADTQTREEIAQRRAAIAAMLASSENAPSSEPAEAFGGDPPAQRRRGPRPVPRRDDAESEDPFVRYTRWERAMIIGGGVTVAFGIALTGAMGSFLWLRDDQVRSGRDDALDPATSADDLRERRNDARRFNGLAISTGAAAAVLTVVGLGVVVAAHVHRNRRRKLPSVGLAPLPGGLAFGFGRRF